MYYLPVNLSVDWDEIERQRDMFEKLHLGDVYLEDDDWNCAEVAEAREGAYSIHDGFFIREEDEQRFHAIIVVYRFKADVAIYYTEPNQMPDFPNALIYETFQGSFEPIGDSNGAVPEIKQWCVDFIAGAGEDFA